MAGTTTIIFSVLIAMLSGLSYAQDGTFTQKRVTETPPADEPSPCEPLELPGRNLKDPKGGTDDSAALLLEQDEKGNIAISIIDKIKDEKHSIVIELTDNLGYYPVKKFLKDIARDFKPKWTKYEEQMKSKEKAFLAGKPVDLKYLPITNLPGKTSRLDFGARPWFYTSSNGTSAKIRSDAYFRICPKKGKPIEICIAYDCFWGGNKFEDWFKSALKYQISLKSK